MDNQTSSKAVAALVLGILGLLFTFGRGILVDFLGLVLCIIALVLSISVRKELVPGEGGRGLATGGMVCAIIGVVGAGISIMCSACALAAIGTGAFTGFHGFPNPFN